VGADGQVIFNDGGVLAGDPQFLWNKTTNLLTVTGSATITGDLTVRTTGMIVKATGTGVKASPSAPLCVKTRNSDSVGLRVLQSTGGTAGIQFTDDPVSADWGSILATSANLFLRSNSLLQLQTGGATERLAISSTGVCTWSNVGGVAGTAMTLNSTGLGVGVVPSAWAAGVKGFEIGSLGSGISSGSTFSGTLYSTCNAYFDGSWKYARNATASLFGLNSDKSFAWFQNSNSPSIGGAITFTQAMTLDASGNLLVGKTVNSIITAGFQSTATGEVSAALAASTDAATQWTTYSTGAAAYRFYVGMGGTVFATNTTISAISDARLKENVQDIDVGLSAILALKPRKFDWKVGKGKDIKGDRGFIAQEFEQVFPQLVDEWKDSAPEGEVAYKSVRQDLIPVLVKAVQELTARVQTLEAK
jgi:hypothetical protein